MKSKQVKLMDLSEITVNEITVSQWKAVRELGADFDNNVAFVMACTGLDVKATDALNLPDYNTLLKESIAINEVETPPASGVAKIALKYPALTVMGERVNEAVITMPKLNAARELSNITGKYNRIEFMIKATTSLADIDSMPLSDYAALTLAVPDFFAQGAEYFVRKV